MKNPSTTYWILEKDEVDVNLVDDDGNNLILMLLQNFTLDEYSVAELKYLVEKRGCQVDVTNKEGMNPLLLAISVNMPIIETSRKEKNKNVQIKKVEQKEFRDRNVQMYEELVRMLLEKYNVEK